MQQTKIDWATHTWNPTSGCNGPNGIPCSYCYARRMAHRFGRSFEPTCHPEKLDEPLHLKNPARIFVDSNGDLFDPTIPDAFIENVFGIMAITPHLTYQVLTKQPKRMGEFVRNSSHSWCVAGITGLLGDCDEHPRRFRRVIEQIGPGWPWPLPNVHLGVTCENQQRAEERIPHLRQTPAAVRFLSVEPMLGAIDLARAHPCGYYCDKTEDGWGWPMGHHDHDFLTPGCKPDIGWVIAGSETGPGARPCKDEWVESLIEQCKAANVPLFVKGKLAERFPVQEYPKVLGP